MDVRIWGDPYLVVRALKPAASRRGELALLFRAVPHDQKLKHLRDRALLGLLGLQALRTIGLMRANVADLQRCGDD